MWKSFRAKIIRQKFPPQSSRLAEFGGLGMSFDIYRGTLGSLAMSAEVSSRASMFHVRCSKRQAYQALEAVAQPHSYCSPALGFRNSVILDAETATPPCFDCSRSCTNRE